MSEENEKQKNGQSHSREIQDVRTVPSGTLFYNLAVVTAKEEAMGGMVQHIEMQKQQQKLLVDPPELVFLKSQLEHFMQMRYIIAQELNSRFKDLDEERCTKLGIQVMKTTEEPPPPSEPGDANERS